MNKSIEIGQKCIRMLGGKIPMHGEIVHLTKEHLYFSTRSTMLSIEQIENQEGMVWKFNRETLGEVDEDLGWDGITKTGSTLRILS